MRAISMDCISIPIPNHILSRIKEFTVKGKYEIDGDKLRIFVSSYAANAHSNFIEVFSNLQEPTEIESIEIDPKFLIGQKLLLIELIAEYGLASVKSKGQARRLMEGGAIKLDNKKIMESTTDLDPENKNLILRIGKYKFYRLIKE